MESEILDLGNALKELMLLSAIPIAIYALWGDYFLRGVETLRSIEESEVDIELELLKIRLAGTIVLVFEAVLFLASSRLRDIEPLLCYSIFITSVALGLAIQTTLENKLHPSPQDSSQAPDEKIGFLLLRVATSWMISAFLHVSLFITFVYSAIAFSNSFHLGPFFTSVLILVSGAAGIMGGLALNTAASAIHIKKTLPTASVEDQRVLELIKACFIDAGLPVPTLSVIELKRLKIAFPIIAGLPIQRGPFKQSFFISRFTLEVLSFPELRAIILNQVSHITLQHIRKKIVLSFALVVMTALPALALMALTSRYSHEPGAIEAIGLILIGISFGISYSILERQTQRHTLEADLHCIQNLGVSSDDLARALIKLDWLTDTHPAMIDPMTQKRILSLRAEFGSEINPETLLGSLEQKQIQRDSDQSSTKDNNKDDNKAA